MGSDKQKRREQMMKLPFLIDLKGKTAVVTGGGGVLCSGFAAVLAKCGANVAVLDLKLEAAKAVAVQINEDGGNAMGVSANVLDKKSLEAAREEVEKAFGKCDILINGAGGNHPKGTTTKEYFDMDDIDRDDIVSFFDLEYEGISFVMNLNFLGTLLPTQVFAKDMVGREGCSIINISSMNSFKPLTKIPAYSAAKAAVSNFTQWLAVHFAPAGIRVNAIAPGFFVTNQNYALLFDADNNPTDRSKKILGHTPLGRFGAPDDLTGTLLWLVSNEAAAFITGVIVPVDGGFSAYSGV
jgi:NAD(P)-dependent dehydrogenase (short-subunit alcohol dehydrogenase family)